MKKQLLRTILVAIATFVQTQITFGQSITWISTTYSTDHTTATIKFNVTGFPGGFLTNVLLTGPNGYSQTQANTLPVSGNPYLLTVFFTGLQVPNIDYNFAAHAQEQQFGGSSADVNGTINTGCVQPTITISNQQANTSCGLPNGSAKATGSGATAPYTYLWSVNNVTDQTHTSLPAGQSSVTVTDILGCAQTATVTIANNANAPTINYQNVLSNVRCFGEANGSAIVGATGGMGPYTIVWPDGFVGSNNTHLTAGTHTVTVTGANGCSTSTSVTITQPPALTLTIANQTDVQCHGGHDGAVIAIGSGGTSPLTFGGGQNSGGVFSSLSAGQNNITLTDYRGCATSQIVTIAEPAEVQITPSMTNGTCYGANNGTGNVAVTGGTTPYSYEWSTGATTQNVSGLAPGYNYWVKVTDANGCTKTRMNLVITQPTQPIVMTPQNHTFEVTPGTLFAQAFEVPNDSLYTITGNIPLGYVFDVTTGYFTLTADPVNANQSFSFIVTGYTFGGCSKAETYYLNVLNTPPSLVALSVDSVPRGNYGVDLSILASGQYFLNDATLTVNAQDVQNNVMSNSGQTLNSVIPRSFLMSPQTLQVGVTNPDGQSSVPRPLKVFNFVTTMEIQSAYSTDWTNVWVEATYYGNYNGNVRIILQCAKTPNSYHDENSYYATNLVTGDVLREVFTDPSQWVYLRYKMEDMNGNFICYSDEVQFFTSPYDVGLNELALIDGTILRVNDVLDNGREFIEYRNLEFGPNNPMLQFPAGHYCSYVIQSKFDGKLYKGKVHRSW